MITRTLVRVAAVGAVCLLVTGCATTRYSQSRIATAPRSAKGRASNDVAFEKDGVKVRIETLDRVRQGSAAPLLSVRIAFEPRALGYSFDPGQVVLRLADGREFRPLSGGYRAVGPRSSMALVFDAAVESSASAELVVAGLARGATPIEPVTLRLSRNEGTSIDRMYWLEAIGVVLSAPLATAGAW